MLKKCNKCGEEKELSMFYKDKINKDGHSGKCKPCKNANTLEWREKNRDKYNEDHRAYAKKHSRRIHFQRSYGITPEQYNEMFAAQDHKCWICSKVKGKKKRPFAMDHCHKTGKTRGIICYSCNRGMYYVDNDEFMVKAKAYLERFSS